LADATQLGYCQKEGEALMTGVLRERARKEVRVFAYLCQENLVLSVEWIVGRFFVQVIPNLKKRKFTSRRAERT
jgi:hypothetical protein